jgi:glycosyltransferase involved in cell wall biosynthesis
MAERILVFIPCYNCAAQVGRVVAQLQGPIAAYVDEVLIVDNGSRDATLNRAAEAIRSLRLPAKAVRNRGNFNLGGSHKAAFAYARREGFSHVLVLHGDDQADAADIVALLESGEHLRHDALLGARFAAGARLQRYSAFRTFGNRAFNLLFTLVSGRRVLDLGSGINLFGPAVISDPSVVRYADDLRFNVYLLLGMILQRRRLLFFPISWREEDQVSNVRLFSQARRTLAIAAAYLLRRSRFLSDDHRDQPRDAYDFDVIAEHRPELEHA